MARTSFVAFIFLIATSGTIAARPLNNLGNKTKCPSGEDFAKGKGSSDLLDVPSSHLELVYRSGAGMLSTGGPGGVGAPEERIVAPSGWNNANIGYSATRWPHNGCKYYTDAVNEKTGQPVPTEFRVYGDWDVTEVQVRWLMFRPDGMHWSLVLKIGKDSQEKWVCAHRHVDSAKPVDMIPCNVASVNVFNTSAGAYKYCTTNKVRTRGYVLASADKLNTKLKDVAAKTVEVMAAITMPYDASLNNCRDYPRQLASAMMFGTESNIEAWRDVRDYLSATGWDLYYNGGVRVLRPEHQTKECWECWGWNTALGNKPAASRIPGIDVGGVQCSQGTYERLLIPGTPWITEEMEFCNDAMRALQETFEPDLALCKPRVTGTAPCN